MPINILKQSRYKLTRPRKVIFELLKKKHAPLSASVIHQKIKNINLTSVYRVLNLFIRLNIVQQEQINGEKYYYLGKKLHHHINCTNCQYTECVPCNHSFLWSKNFTKINHQLTLTGLCHKCANK